MPQDNMYGREIDTPGGDKQPHQDIQALNALPRGRPWNVQQKRKARQSQERRSEPHKQDELWSRRHAGQRG
ncbi:hypothetical protein Asru_0084_09 [Acidisphaera rubrifaciens HS-AP3]|uniref:Uncharacterized protein n=1 Tax=Acidisphaera rubrifaciens HS-AP3 TaxID=1231350 RepID=A0A0D6P528_9PROT|nr:hypothetical protein Asru_0084_09 [Acidisphaera rubrifaciens HS-AP3]